MNLELQYKIFQLNTRIHNDQEIFDEENRAKFARQRISADWAVSWRREILDLPNS